MNTKVWAHRGASGYAPENTLEAFELAARQKADGVELDVQLSKDGELVVIHDETIDRVTDGKGKVKDFTVRELKSFKANQTHPEYANAIIPTLEEVYDLLKPIGLKINVELKTGIYFYPDIEKKLLALTRKKGMEEKVWYSSFNHYSLIRLKELEPSVRTGIPMRMVSEMSGNIRKILCEPTRCIPSSTTSSIRSIWRKPEPWVLKPMPGP